MLATPFASARRAERAMEPRVMMAPPAAPTMAPLREPRLAATRPEAAVDGTRVGVTEAEKLALLESLMEAVDDTTCAEHAVDWARTTLGLGWAACAAVDASGAHLVGLASCGMAAELADLSAPLDARDNPFVRAVHGVEPQELLASPELGGQPLAILPLRGRQGSATAPGVLVTALPPPAARVELGWLARVLGLRLADLACERGLRRGAEQKTQFFACLAHELRTPLNAIFGYTAMLLKGTAGQLAPRQLAMVTRIDANGRTLLSLVNDILDIARIEAGKMPVALADVSVRELVGELLGEIEPLIAASGLAFETELAPATLRVDRRKTKQIWLNLVANALKFTPRGAVRIASRPDPARGRVELSVSDTGIGIAPADQALLFVDFQQVPGARSRDQRGAGLGLSISRRLATLLGGELSLSSSPGLGSTFTLSLPAVSERPSLAKA